MASALGATVPQAGIPRCTWTSLSHGQGVTLGGEGWGDRGSVLDQLLGPQVSLGWWPHCPVSASTVTCPTSYEDACHRPSPHAGPPRRPGSRLPLKMLDRAPPAQMLSLYKVPFSGSRDPDILGPHRALHHTHWLVDYAT